MEFTRSLHGWSLLCCRLWPYSFLFLHYWKTPAICPASPITWTGLSSAVKPVENRLLLWLWALAAMLQALQAAVSLILPRERLIAILTNNFMPCNGRLPLFITLILLFLCSSQQNAASYAVSALILTLFILLGIAMTFLSSYLLSATVLRGVSSSFTLEMPPYRRPQIGKVILRSVTDRTLFVLGRAAAVAAPAGLILWLLANVSPGGISLLSPDQPYFRSLAACWVWTALSLQLLSLDFPPTRSSFPLSLWPIQPRGI